MLVLGWVNGLVRVIKTTVRTTRSGRYGMLHHLWIFGLLTSSRKRRPQANASDVRRGPGSSNTTSREVYNGHGGGEDVVGVFSTKARENGAVKDHCVASRSAAINLMDEIVELIRKIVK